MSYETFATSSPPLRDPTRPEESARTLSAGFGDGYSQESGDGLNAVSMTVRLSWRLPVAEVQEKLAFLRARAGYAPFWWTLPRETAPRLWRCKSWGGGYRWRLDILEATFTEVHDL